MQTVFKTSRFFSLSLATVVLWAAQSSDSARLLANEKGNQKSLPEVGDVAKDFTLQTTAGKKFQLKEFAKDKKTVLVVLRGFPGYQCPLCTRQVGEFLSKIEAIKNQELSSFLFTQARACNYPKSERFPQRFQLPEGATVLLDPDYRFTLSYGLRWNSPNETAYPSTFVLGSSLKIHFAKISKTHGGRSSVSQVLSALKKF